MEKIPLFWATPEADLVANAYGYVTHNKNMKRFSEPFFEYRDDAEIALTIAPGDKFNRIPGKYNILFTMWELLDIPPSYVEGMARADALIVPCRFCKELFARVFPREKIWVCNEGVDETVYTFKERRFPDMANGEKFRFLWVGAPNPRKGYPFILEMTKVFEQVPTVEIYMKTTMPKLDWWTTIKNVVKKRKEIMRNDKNQLYSLKRMIQRIPKPYYNNRVLTMGKNKNIILDTRKLALKDLVGLYHSAHAFVLPHMGEGWGLTLCEAMATGCPSISVSETGCKDFFDGQVGYPLKTQIIGQQIREYDLKEGRAHVPNVKDLLDQMTAVMMNYKEALSKGRSASERIRERFTWSMSGRRLRQVIDEINVKKGMAICRTSSQKQGTISI